MALRRRKKKKEEEERRRRRRKKGMKEGVGVGGKKERKREKDRFFRVGALIFNETVLATTLLHRDA